MFCGTAIRVSSIPTPSGYFCTRTSRMVKVKMIRFLVLCLLLIKPNNSSQDANHNSSDWDIVDSDYPEPKSEEYLSAEITTDSRPSSAMSDYVHDEAISKSNKSNQLLFNNISIHPADVSTSSSLNGVSNSASDNRIEEIPSTELNRSHSAAPPPRNQYDNEPIHSKSDLYAHVITAADDDAHESATALPIDLEPATHFAADDINPFFNETNTQIKRAGSHPVVTTNTSNVNQLAIARPEALRAPGQTSLVIVFDGTGSMYDCLVQLRSGAKLIIEKFAHSDANPIYNYVFVPFRDPDIGPELVTTDHQELFAALDNLTLRGGGDCPESALKGIHAALTVALPQSYVYIFTDAIAKDFRLDNKVLELIRKKQTTLTFLLTGFCNSKDQLGYKVYEKLASASNGQVYNLQEQDISEVINDIKNSLDKRRVALKYLDSPTAETHSFDIAIDENLKEFKVSVAGLKPNITIFDPQHDNYIFAESVLNLDNLKVLNVPNPQPGDWKIVAGSESSHSVRLTALSEVIFTFGFSLHEPISISETLFNPLIGKNNIFSVSPSDTALINNLTAIRITLHLDDRRENPPEKAISFKLDLHPIRPNSSTSSGQRGNDDAQLLYATKAFEPPRRPFKIEISGFDKYGNPLHRLLSTIVQSTEESAPEVFTEPLSIDGRQTDNITLECVAQSLVPMTVQWRRDDAVLRKNDFTQTTTFTYDIVNAQPRDTGRYACHAENHKGFSESFINLQVRPQEIRIQMKNHTYWATENDATIHIGCEILPDDAQVEWLMNGHPLECQHSEANEPSHEYQCIDTGLVVRNVSRRHAGTYQCVASTKYERKTDEASLSVYYPPEFRDPHYLNISTEFGQFLVLSCSDVDGYPSAEIAWKLLHGVILPTNDSFQIAEFTEEDEGTYECVANNGVGPPIKRVFSVYGIAGAPPVVAGPRSTVVEATAGTDVRLTCDCTRCEPLTAYSWSVESTQLNASLNPIQTRSGANLELDIDRPWSASTSTRSRNYAAVHLNITNVTAANEGVYTCRLSNQRSRDASFDAIEVESTKQVFLKVVMLPIIESLTLLDAQWTANDSSSLVAMINSSNSLVCRAAGIPSPRLMWFKDGEPLENIQRNITNETLIFKEIRQNDAGNYTCRVENALGFDTLAVDLQVVVVPSFSGTHNENELIESFAGHRVYISCAVSGNPEPTILWFVNSFRLDTTTDKYVSVNNTLEFQASALDSGIYECRAANKYGAVARQTTLLIYADLRSDALGIDNSHNDDSGMHNNATVVELKWIVDGEVSSLDGGRQLSMMCKQTELNLITNHDDLLLRTAINLVKETLFFVCKSNESPNNLNSSKTYILAKNNTSFKILRNNSILECSLDFNSHPNQTIVHSNDTSANRVHIAGNYTCRPKNPHHSGSPNNAIELLAIRVIKPPQFLHSGQNPFDPHQQAVLGAPLELHCPYENHNTLNWLKDKQMLTTSTATTTIPTTMVSASAADDDVMAPPPPPPLKRPNGRLWFDRVDWQHAGNYTCWVENEAGSAHFSYHLDVISAPRRIGVAVDGQHVADAATAGGDGGHQLDESTELTVMAGEPVFEVECVVSANPVAAIKWMRDDRPIADDKLLRILRPKIDDSGRYTCLAHNVLGSANRSYNLVVTSAPKYADAGEQDELDVVLEQSVGNDVTLNCTMHANPVARYEWSQNGKLINHFAPVIQIDKVNTTHDGTYECKASNAFGQQQVTFYVTITAVPVVHLEPIAGRTDTNATIDITLVEPNPLELRCSASGAPTPILSWTLNGRTLLSTARVHNLVLAPLADGNVIVINELGNIVNESWSLEVPPHRQGRVQRVVRSDGGGVMVTLAMRMGADEKKVSGNYTCSAVNAVGKDERVFRLSVLVPPTFKSSKTNATTFEGKRNPSLVTTLAGSPVMLPCAASGRPKPDLYWFRGDINLSALDDEQDERFLIMSGGKVLTLLQPSVRDAGEYTCMAKNAAGNSSTWFNVSVLEPPSIRRPSTSLLLRSADNGPDEPDDLSEEIHVKEGDTVQLHCPVSGNPMPTVTWLKLHYDDDEYREERVMSSANTTSLIINAINEPATYKCFVNSTVGEIKLLFHIAIDRAPQFERLVQRKSAALLMSEDTEEEEEEVGADVDTVKVTLYKGFTLDCPVIGEPEPNVSWYKNEIKMTPETDANVFISSNGHVLRVHSAARDDGGQYDCVATNPFGIISRRFVVNVNVIVHWSPWSRWTNCNASCGQGVRSRSRLCLLTSGKLALPEDARCHGPSSEYELCQINPCPIDGAWSDWDHWSECSNACVEDGNSVESTKQRFRRCDQPAPRYGGRECVGRERQTEICDVPNCPVDGRWSVWDDWSECSSPCGNGTRMRRRYCDSPAPRHGGIMCGGVDTETDRCFVKSCAVHGGWSKWSAWSQCGQTCGTSAQRYRKRVCSQPAPANGGRNCKGSSLEIKPCRLPPCHYDNLQASTTTKNYSPFITIVNPYTFEKTRQYESEEYGDEDRLMIRGNDEFDDTLDEGLNMTRNVTVTVKHHIPITDDMMPIIVNRPDGQGPITISNAPRLCELGFEFVQTKCLDINECRRTHGCSHQCVNTRGSYRCLCPDNLVLFTDYRNCVQPTYVQQEAGKSNRLPSTMGNNHFDGECHDGYDEINGLCRDTNECATFTHACSITQTCLNTKGSYLCIPNTCPSSFSRSSSTGQCIQVCARQPSQRCSDGAKIAQYIRTSVVQMASLDADTPIIKLATYDHMDHQEPLLMDTHFTFGDRHAAETFILETSPLKPGVALVYANANVQRDKLHTISVNARQIGADDRLLYIRKFVLHVYVG